MSRQFRRVDKARFQELTFPHLAFLYNLALKYTGKPDEAEDIVQETMYTAYRKFYQLRDEGKCRQWLFSILRTSFLREKRLLKRRPLLDDGSGYLKHVTGESTESLVAALEKKVDRELVRTVLGRLPDNHRMVLILYYMEEMTYQEIADYLDIPIGTVMSRLSRAKKQMKKGVLKHMQRRSGVSKVLSLVLLSWREVC